MNADKALEVAYGVARVWAAHRRDEHDWESLFSEMVSLFGGDIEFHQGPIHLRDVVDTCIYDFNLTLADFIRLKKIIKEAIIRAT